MTENNDGWRELSSTGESGIGSTAPVYKYDFFQNTTDTNMLHLSVHSMDTGAVLNMQFSAPDAMRMFASLCRILSKMKNHHGEPLGKDFVKKVVEDENLANQISLYASTHPLYAWKQKAEDHDS